MEVDRSKCRQIAAVVFLFSTILTTAVLHSLQFSDILALTGAIFTATITTGIWLEVSYRFLVKQATAPLDKLAKKL